MLRILLISLLLAVSGFAQNFHLRDGDRVVFFGDSITDQRLYTTFVETYVVTRFPRWNVTFVHSGWGGDRVTGGSGGGIDERLDRDVIPYKPSAVSIMLGMNDGRVRAFDTQIFEIYSNGYKHIVERLKAALPGVRITAIEPSPYDDVTRRPLFPGGYNAVLLRYGQFLQQLASEQSLTVADLNRPVTAMLEKANHAGPELAKKIIPDRVHPREAGHLIMAESLLKGWQAPGLVSSVEIDAGAKRVANSENTAVINAGFGPSISWTQTDDALPVPVDMDDEVMALTVKSSDFLEAMNRQILRVTGLAPGKHTLRVDGEEMLTAGAEEWARGVNLAGYKTPMWEQAARVHALTLKRANAHNVRWRSFQVPLQYDNLAGLQPTLTAIDDVDSELMREQHAAAQPKPHHFELVPGDSQFHSIFNGSDLTGWHISQTNHHGNTQGWKIESGAITATQDRPKNGGILLTGRKYRNFEISLEIRPDYGCDSGLFLRSSEKGEAYQVLLDYLDGGAIGGIYGEKLTGVQGFIPQWQEVFKRGEWNHLKARIEGDVPHIQVWLNGVRITDWRDTANHAAGGAVDGMVALQVHGGNRWIPGAKHRFRNIMIRELP
ncbi:MAG: DUF1080 domain-containing protein [Bryobacterales bacterium]|nr:DUF1080 domain-containing protein [Bryobacterales bacterium]